MSTLPIVSTFRTSGNESLLFTKLPSGKTADPHIVINHELAIFNLHGFKLLPRMRGVTGLASLSVKKEHEITGLELTFDNQSILLAEVRGPVQIPMLEQWTKNVNAQLRCLVTISTF